jgi:hypothetical protein
VQFSGFSNAIMLWWCQSNLQRHSLRMGWPTRISWIASIGDQLTDSVGHYLGIKIKLPNVWFDKSKAPNQYTQGTVPPLNSHGDITEEDWSTQCNVKPQAHLLLALFTASTKMLFNMHLHLDTALLRHKRRCLIKSWVVIQIFGLVMSSAIKEQKTMLILVV